MTILSLALGADRAVLIQDTGRFQPESPHAQVGTASKIVAVPHSRLIAGGAGEVAGLLEWQRQLAAGVAGETLAEIAAHAPGLLRAICRDRWSLTVVVATLDDAGRAGALAMQGAFGYTPERIRRGTVLLLPDTAEEVEPAQAVAADDTQPEPPAHDDVRPEPPSHADVPAEPEWVDWPAVRLKLLRGVREQVRQRRIPFAPPFYSALLHPEGIDLRRFHL